MGYFGRHSWNQMPGRFAAGLFQEWRPSGLFMAEGISLFPYTMESAIQQYGAPRDIVYFAYFTDSASETATMISGISTVFIYSNTIYTPVKYVKAFYGALSPSMQSIGGDPSYKQLNVIYNTTDGLIGSTSVRGLVFTISGTMLGIEYGNSNVSQIEGLYFLCY